MKKAKLYTIACNQLQCDVMHRLQAAHADEVSIDCDFNRKFSKILACYGRIRLSSKIKFPESLVDVKQPWMLSQHLTQAQSHRVYEDIFQLVEQTLRNANDYRLRGHHLVLLREQVHYFHLLADYIGRQLIENKIDVIILFNVPHLLWDYLLCMVADALGLRTYILTQSVKFPDRCESMVSWRDFGHWRAHDTKPEVLPYKIDQQVNETPWYMGDITQGPTACGRWLTSKECNKIIFYIFFRAPRLLCKPVQCYRLLIQAIKTRQALPRWRCMFDRYFSPKLLDYFSSLLQFESNIPDLSAKYVYFPLQEQPEASTAPCGGRYVDLALATEMLATILPKDCKIYIKENPKQKNFRRDALFFERLQRTGKVIVVPSYTSTHLLLEHAQCVATVTGTVAWEAICCGKNAIVFGQDWFFSFDGIFQFTDTLNFQQVMDYQIDHAVLEQQVAQYRASLPKGVVDEDYRHVVSDYDPVKNACHLAQYIVDLVLKREDVVFHSRSATGATSPRKQCFDAAIKEPVL